MKNEQISVLFQYDRLPEICYPLMRESDDSFATLVKAGFRMIWEDENLKIFISSTWELEEIRRITRFSLFQNTINGSRLTFE